ncbi:MAG: metal ABC transporter substrate-binding protein [Actinomycetota bacterium]|nr:metal ABC transporter substrate-binding protein [Actinomycetota bacterium]
MLRITFVLLALSAACGGGDAGDDRLSVVASFFPLAEVARAVGADDVRVDDLTPVDAEPHDFEPGPDDIDRIEDANVLLYLGGGFQPAVERAAKRSDAQRVELLKEGDPHVWLDPVAMQGIARRVAEAMAVADPEHAEAHRRRGSELATRLGTLHDEYVARLRQCDRRVMVTTHDAFSRLAARYDLRQEALTGTAPEAEPDPRRVAAVLDVIDRDGVTTVFTEGTDDTRAAQALAREAGVRTAVLPTLERPTPGGYLEGMRANLGVLADALGCRR